MFSMGFPCVFHRPMEFSSGFPSGFQYLFDYAVARGLSLLRPAVDSAPENQLVKALRRRGSGFGLTLWVFDGVCWMEFDQQKWVVFHDFHGDINGI